MNLNRLILLTLLAAPAAHAGVPDASGRELKSLRGRHYGALSSAITNFNEVPVEDRAKSPAADRALTQVRHALRELERAPGQAKLPINTSMTDAQLARSLKRVRVADAFCNVPVVAFYIFHPETGLKIQSHTSHDTAPSLADVRAANPGCEVHGVYYSYDPSAAR